MRTRVGRICPPYPDARQRRILKLGFDRIPMSVKGGYKNGGLTPALIAQWILSQSKVYDRRIPLCERGVLFPRMTVKMVLGGAR